MQIKKADDIFIKNFLSIIFIYRKNIDRNRDNKDLQLATCIVAILLLMKGIIQDFVLQLFETPGLFNIYVR